MSCFLTFSEGEKDAVYSAVMDPKEEVVMASNPLFGTAARTLEDDHVYSTVFMNR